MPRLSAFRVAKVAFALVILMLVLYHTFNYEDPDKTFPQIRNEENLLENGRILKERDGHYADEQNPPEEHNVQKNDSKKPDEKGNEIKHPVGDTKEQEEKEWMAKMDQRNSDRKALVREVCEERYQQSFRSWDELAKDPSHLRPLIVNDDHRFIYSIVYKVGSTNWERVIVQDLGGFKNIPNQKLYSHHALKWMPKFASSQTKSYLESYTKFIFVRDPLSRILSGYKDKFVDHHNVVFGKMARFIIKNYRTDSDVNTSPNATFTEFIRYLVDKEGHRSNVHWKPVHNQNFPCEIEYDIIGKLEDAHEDIPYVLKRVGIYDLTDYGKGPPKPPNSDLIKQYYSQLPTDLLHKLYKLYEPDFKLFGYDMPQSFT